MQVVRGQQGRERVEVVEERWRRRVEAYPHEATPPVDSDCLEPGPGRYRVELVGVDNVDETAIEVVAPRVVAAADAAVREGSRSVREPCPAMQARVVKGVDGVRVRAHDEDGLIADQVLAELAHVGDLFLPAGDLPDAGPQPLELECGELRTRVTGARHGVVLADQDAVEGHVAVPSDHGMTAGPRPVCHRQPRVHRCPAGRRTTERRRRRHTSPSRRVSKQCAVTRPRLDSGVENASDAAVAGRISRRVRATAGRGSPACTERGGAAAAQRAGLRPASRASVCRPDLDARGAPRRSGPVRGPLSCPAEPGPAATRRCLAGQHA